VIATQLVARGEILQRREQLGQLVCVRVRTRFGSSAVVSAAAEWAIRVNAARAAAIEQGTAAHVARFAQHWQRASLSGWREPG
jgi:hypothetical protein